ncbi:hypothetical protein SUGI_0496280 [Cryptomeria japonica]|nr:hypothetical protein SUGI_0496280 [Cryptomeria japonica]
MEFAKAFMDSQHFTSELILLLWTVSLASLLVLLAVKIQNRGRGKNLPPGKLGLPLIGETLQFMRAHRANKSKEWVQSKVSKYGHVFKTSLMGRPTIVLTGQAGNRFIFNNDYKIITNKQTSSVSRLLGPKNLLDLPVDDHKRMRGAIMSFMKPEVLQKFLGIMESVILQHFAEYWQGKENITVAPLMKQLTFHVACDLLFCLKDENERKVLGNDISNLIKVFLEARRRELQQGKASPSQDLISCLLSMEDDKNMPLTEDEIIDNMILIMLAGHDTTTVLFTHLVRMLALNPSVYHSILQEQMEVLSGKQPNEPLQWKDIQKMKYTWKVAQEILRFIPPVVGGFRRAIQDVEYGGYTIPKGWQLFWTTGITHWDEEAFKEPYNFDPTHFDDQLPPYTFIPFGAGPRICPGYDFAKIETIIFLHHLVTKYKWSLIYLDEKIICDPMPTPSKDLPIKLHAKGN